MLDFEWVAIAFGDVTWLTIAFLCGFIASQLKLPPLIGYLTAGFILNYYGFSSGEMLHKLADLGITLLLFAVGLKLDLKNLFKPQIWAVTSLHIAGVILFFGSIFYLLLLLSVPPFNSMNLGAIILISFSLSFSSTVFAVKNLEGKREVASLHGKIAIGILVMQDLLAVIFLASSDGKIPALIAPAIILLLVLARPLLNYILTRSGHGELLILYAFVLAIGGANLFELGGIKDDLGALFMGVIIAQHEKSKQMARAIMGFKDIFLIGFFLTVGMSGQITLEAVLIALLIQPLILIKSGLFFRLMTGFNVRSRTALLASLNLSNYSEFGLIVIAIGVSQGWVNEQWLTILALSLSFSFILAAPLNRKDHDIFNRFQDYWIRFQSETRLPEDQSYDVQGAKIAIVGMGRVGAGAFDNMHQRHGDLVIGIDFDQQKVDHHQARGRNVIRGNPTDPYFWDNFKPNPEFQLIILTLPFASSCIEVIEHLRAAGYNGRFAATARYQKDEDIFNEAGVNEIFNLYKNAGASFAQTIDTKTI